VSVVRAAVLTISTSIAAGDGEDVSGSALAELCGEAGLEVTRETLPDDREAIASALKRLADHEGLRFVFTTGGTGFTPDDVTPEATRDAIDREAPGIAETIRSESRRHTPLGILTRGVSGIRGRTLIVNFPGNPKAISQSWPVVEPTLRHAAETLERG
jgi:molybdenum cofactor synthesis domain-containing protein